MATKRPRYEYRTMDADAFLAVTGALLATDMEEEGYLSMDADVAKVRCLTQEGWRLHSRMGDRAVFEREVRR